MQICVGSNLACMQINCQPYKVDMGERRKSSTREADLHIGDAKKRFSYSSAIVVGVMSFRL